MIPNKRSHIDQPHILLKTLMLALGLTYVSCQPPNTGIEHQEMSAVYNPEPISVGVMVLARTVFKKELISNGRLRAARKTELHCRVSSELISLNMYNGLHVSAGQVLARLESFTYQQQLSQAETALKKATIDLEDELLSYGGVRATKENIPALAYEGAAIRSGYITALREVEVARHNLAATTIKAPFAGKVANFKHHLHEQLNTGELLCDIIDDSQMEVEFHLLESEISEVALHDAVTITPFSRRLYQGHVSEVNPQVDENGMVLLKARVDNDGALWDGMHVKVYLEKEIPAQLVVPKSAVVLRQNQEVLFRYTHGRARWTYLESLYENSTSYAVQAHPQKGGNLQPGDTVIISDNLALGDEAVVRIK